MRYWFSCLAALLISLSLAAAQEAASSPAPKSSPSPAASATPKPKKNKKKDKKKSGQGDSSKTPGTAAKDDKETPAATSTPSDDFQIPLGNGQPVTGVRIPNYSPDGKLQMLFNAQTAQKLDDKHIAMDRLTIDAYGDDGKKFFIETPKSIFNLETRILNGSESVLIRRDDFEIVGDTGEFHTKTRFAKVIGNVKMTIFNTENYVK